MAEGQLRDSIRSIPTFFLHNENQDTDLHQWEPTQVRWDGRDGRRELDSGLGHTQDYRTGYTDDDDWTFTQWTEQPVGRKRRARGRPAVNRIPEETGVPRDSRWDSPRKRALSTSDGPDNMTSGNDIPEGHADRPPEIEYSERLTSAKRQDEGGTERLGSANMELEMAIIQLQRDVVECRTELELARKQTLAVTLRPRGSRRRRFQDTPGSRTGNSTARCSRPLYVRMAGTRSRRPYSCSLIWTTMHSTWLCWFRSLEGWCQGF